MIFLTVGSQTPFNRLVRAVDEWAALRKRRDVFAQIGLTNWYPNYIKWTRLLKPSQFQEVVKKSDILIAHAGMGSIITALEVNKPIIVMPRRSDLRETRNDHQTATAKYFSQKKGIFAAWNKKELYKYLDNIPKLQINPKKTKGFASTRLIKTVKDFINKNY